VLKLSRDTGLPYTNADYFRMPSYLKWSPTNAIRIDQWLADHYGVDIHYNRHLFNAIEAQFGQGVIQNNPDEGNPFDDMIYLDREKLEARGIALADVADFVEDAFDEYVYRAFTIDEIFAE
jgi:hypothetical protein